MLVHDPQNVQDLFHMLGNNLIAHSLLYGAQLVLVSKDSPSKELSNGILN